MRKTNKSREKLRLEIMESALASFSVDGIIIPRHKAIEILEKIEMNATNAKDSIKNERQ